MHQAASPNPAKQFYPTPAGFFWIVVQNRDTEREREPGVKRTTDEHGADGEDLLGVCVGADVPKAHTGQAAEGEVESSDVGAADRRAAHCAVDVRSLQTFAQLMKPSWGAKQNRFKKLSLFVSVSKTSDVSERMEREKLKSLPASVVCGYLPK